MEQRRLPCAVEGYEDRVRDSGEKSREILSEFRKNGCIILPVSFVCVPTQGSSLETRFPNLLSAMVVAAC
jgi:hypothetical protein